MRTSASMDQNHGEIGRTVFVQFQKRDDPLVGQTGAFHVHRVPQQTRLRQQRLEPPQMPANFHESQRFGIGDLLAQSLVSQRGWQHSECIIARDQRPTPEDKARARPCTRDGPTRDGRYCTLSLVSLGLAPGRPRQESGAR